MCRSDCSDQSEMIRDFVEKHDLLVSNVEGSAARQRKLSHTLPHFTLLIISAGDQTVWHHNWVAQVFKHWIGIMKHVHTLMFTSERKSRTSRFCSIGLKWTLQLSIPHKNKNMNIKQCICAVSLPMMCHSHGKLFNANVKYSWTSGKNVWLVNFSEFIHHWQMLILDPGFCDSVTRASIPHDTTPSERVLWRLRWQWSRDVKGRNTTVCYSYSSRLRSSCSDKSTINQNEVFLFREVYGYFSTNSPKIHVCDSRLNGRHSEVSRIGMTVMICRNEQQAQSRVLPFLY